MTIRSASPIARSALGFALARGSRVILFRVSKLDLLISRMLKNAHLRRHPHPSSLQPFRVLQYPKGPRSSGFLGPCI